MPPLVYVEPEEEISDLIERVRGASGDEAALVLPAHPRMLQSAVNVRLLQQYSRTAGKRTVLITNDTRVQELSRAAGMPVFASVQAFERGVASGGRDVPPPPPRPVPLSGGVPGTAAGVGAGVAAAAVAAQAGAGPAAPPAPVTGAARPVAARAVPPPLPPPAPGPTARSGRPPAANRAWWYGGVAVAIVLVLLLTVVAPSVVVTVTETASLRTADAVIQGTKDASLAGSPNHIRTLVVNDHQSAGFQATPTGQKQVPAAKAQARLVFTTDLPTGAQFTVPRNTEFDATDGSRFYAVQDTFVNIPPPTGGSRATATDTPVTVQAGNADAKSNVGANAITQWPQNPCDPKNGATSCSPSDLTVGNPQPAAGGADAQTLTVVSDTDLRSFQSQVAQLEQQLRGRMETNMLALAGGRQFAQDATGNGKSFVFTVQPALPKVGDLYNPTQVTIAGTSAATVYSLQDVQRVMQANLGVAANESFVRPPTLDKPAVTQATDDGTAIISAHMSGYVVPRIDVTTLRDKLPGKGPDEARRIIHADTGVDVSHIAVQQWPLPLPWLPFFASRVDVKVATDQGQLPSS